MMKTFKTLLLLTVLLSLASCGNRQDTSVHLLRFEQFLFSDQTSANETEFRSPLINYHPEDPAFMAMVNDFTSDPVIRDIYHTTDSLYHDLGWLERELDKALGKAEQLHPGIRYDRFFTLVTADFDNYSSRVFCNEHELAISLDRYALPAMERYSCFGVPAYIVRMSTREHILPDCMAAIAREHIVLPEGEMSLLDYAVAEGKTLYFVEQTLPRTADTLRLRYSGEQLEWMKENIANVWSWYLQNRMLYSTDLTVLRNLIDDAPKTNAFGEGSAPRTAAYIGLQIVRAYMKKSGDTMQQLFEETDSRKILNTSGWRP